MGEPLAQIVSRKATPGMWKNSEPADPELADYPIRAGTAKVFYQLVIEPSGRKYV